MVMKFKELEFNTFILTSVDDIVRHDFIAQKSISYLDLNNSDYSRGSKFVNTHEGFRKAVVKDRKIIYNFHLDLPISLEQQLEKVEQLDSITTSPSFHISKMSILEDYYPRQFAALIVSGIKTLSEKLKVIREYLSAMKTTGCRELIFKFKMCFSFLNILIKDGVESNVLVEFINICGSLYSCLIVQCENTEFLQFVLFHSQKMRINFWPCASPCECVLNSSIHHGYLNNVPHILKYGKFGRKHPLTEDRDL